MNRSAAMIIWWKEFRAVLPVWMGIMVALWLPGLTGMRLLGVPPSQWCFFCLFAGGAGLAAMVYARDFHDRTIIWQLLQPEGRQRILVRKFAVLLLLLASLVVSFAVLTPNRWPEMSPDRYGILGLMAALALTSVCFWSVCTKNLLATFVMTFAGPMLLQLLAIPWLAWLWKWRGLTEAQAMMANDAAMMDLLILYSLVTGIAAVVLWRRLQLRGEAVAAPGLDVRWFVRFAARPGLRVRRTWVALIRKEIGLLRIVIWMAVLGGLLACLYFVADRWLGSLADHWETPGARGPVSDRGPAEWREQLHLLGSVGLAFYLALVPTLAGALAFAEESHLGLRGWHLCLPSSAGRQWLIKIGTALGLSVSAGLFLPGMIALPIILAAAGHPGLDAIKQPIVIHLMLFCVAAWCASWSRSTALALAKALLLILGLVMLTEWITTWTQSQWPDWQMMAWPAMTFALGFTLFNFRRVEVPVRIWSIQLAVLVLVTYVMSIAQVALARPYEFW
jgi:hypothetical protein